MQIDFTAGVQATTYGTGPFHPAIRNGKTVWYWPNITYATEDEAYTRAARILADTLDFAQKAAGYWNVYEAL